MVIYPEPVGSVMTIEQPAFDPAGRTPLDVGQRALAAGAWHEARSAFEEVLQHGDVAAALEGLGLAAWWLDAAETVFEARERAFRLYREQNDARSAARVAVWIGWDYAAFRGEGAVARGWLALGRQLLAGHTNTPEYAWLLIREGVLTLFEEGKPDVARQLAADAGEAARAAGSRDYELLAQSLEGLAMVTAGEVSNGMRQLDGVSAAIIGGEMHDWLAIGLSGCYLIAACDRIRDYDRAAQWCTRIKAFCAKWGLRPLFAVCRAQYATVCLWHGRWDEAEFELVAAVRELSEARPAMTGEGAVRLGELRRRQGRLDEAQQLFDGAAGHPLALVGQAALALDKDDAVGATDLAERYLRGVHEQNLTERVGALELIVRARVASGTLAEADHAAQELDETAQKIGTFPLRATARLCRGMLAAAAGDLVLARHACEDAIDLFQRSGSLFEVARARLELATVLSLAGRTPAAIGEVERALEELKHVSADQELARAERMLDQMRGRAVEPSDTAGLTKRELDVLNLVAKGSSNQRVAEQLFISEHTVHRHVANIFAKLGVSTRSAAVARAARLGLLND
jgi:DNA-binding CsgD family transcriptional regulator